LPSEVVAAVKAEFGLSITRSTVEVYDPGKVSGRNLSKKLADLFHVKRSESSS
jgi:hypothetical protein